MKKLRFCSSISPILGESKSFVSKPISINPSFTSHAESSNHRYLFEGVKGFQRWLHNAYACDDDFSELGEPTIQGGSTRLKLATEKPDNFKLTKDTKGAARNASGSKLLDVNLSPATKETTIAAINATVDKPSDVDLIPYAKDLLTNLEKSSHFHPKLEKPTNSVTTGKSKYDVKNSTSICIGNVPSAVNLFKVIEAVSSFGKISDASVHRVSVDKELYDCSVKFEDEGSSRRAVSAGRITIGSFDLPVRLLNFHKSVAIRIKDISKDTAYTAVHSICGRIGELVGMAKATENTIDAFFSLKGFSDEQNILAELNNQIVDDCQWSAQVLAQAAQPSSPAVLSKNDIRQLGSKVSSDLGDLRNEINMRRTYLEDLEYMHLAVMHLEEQHTVDSASEIN